MFGLRCVRNAAQHGFDERRFCVVIFREDGHRVVIEHTFEFRCMLVCEFGRHVGIVVEYVSQNTYATVTHPVAVVQVRLVLSGV